MKKIIGYILIGIPLAFLAYIFLGALLEVFGDFLLENIFLAIITVVLMISAFVGFALLNSEPTSIRLDSTYTKPMIPPSPVLEKPKHNFNLFEGETDEI